MLKKYLITFCLISLISINSNAAGTGGTGTTKSDYDKAVTIIKSAKKYEKKGKTEKANKRYEKAQKLLIKSNKKKPLQADTLNYLVFMSIFNWFINFVFIISKSSNNYRNFFF